MILKNTDEKKRYSIFPIKNNDLWERYKAAEAQTWVAKEVDLSKDKYDELSDGEKFYLKNILAFFTISDGLVIENLNTDFSSETNIMEAEFYYGHQTFIEQVHAEGYGLLIEQYIKNIKEKEDLFDSMETSESVRKKASWAEKWIASPSFVERLVAFSLVEGICFSSVFAGVFWFRSRNKMEGLGEMNQFIVDDETGHYEFALNLYKNYVKDEHKLSKDRLREMILECFEVEKTFVLESMPSGLSGLTKEMMVDYVKFVVDIVLNDYGCESEFNQKNPLSYMARIGLSSKNNFFERRTGEYTRVDIPSDKKRQFDTDF